MKAGFWEILLVVVLVLILFGHSKIPDLMKNLANGINIFKKELKTNSSEKEEKPVAETKAPVKSVAKKKPAAKKKPVAKKVTKSK